MALKMHSIRKLDERLQIQTKDAECNKLIPVSCGCTRPINFKRKSIKSKLKIFEKKFEKNFLQNKILDNNFTTDRRVHWKAGARKETDASVTPSAKSKFQKFWNYDTTEFWFWKRSKGRNIPQVKGSHIRVDQNKLCWIPKSKLGVKWVSLKNDQLGNYQFEWFTTIACSISYTVYH